MLVSNNSNHVLKRTANAICSGSLKKVNEVSCPTGNVCMVYTSLIMVGNIHCAEYVANVCLLTVGKLEIVKSLKTCNRKIWFCFSAKENLSVDHIFHIGYEFSKVCILVTSHNTPRTGIVSFNTGTDILNYKCSGILCRILHNVLVSKLLKDYKIINKVIVIVDRCFAKSGYLLVRSGFTALCTNVMSLVACLCTGRCLSIQMDHIMSKSINEYVSVTKYTHLSIGTGCFCSGYVCKLIDQGRSNSFGTANRALLSCGITVALTSRINCGNIYLGMTVSRNYLLCYRYNSTSSTLLTLGKTCFGTCGSNCFKSFFSVSCRIGVISNAAITTNTTGVGCITSIGTRRSSYRCIIAVSKRSNLVSNVSVTATATRVSCITFLGTRRSSYYCIVAVSKLRNRSLCRDNLATGRALLTLGKTCFGTSRCLGRNNFLGMNVTYPYTVNKCISIVSTGNVGSVSILKLSGGERDSLVRITIIFIRCHDSRGFRTYLELYRSTLFTMDISTTCRGICISLRTVKHSTCLDVNFGIYKVCIGTCICSAGSMLYRNKRLICSTRKGSPLISIKYINLYTGGKTKFSIRTNDKLSTGEKSNVLANRNIAGMYIYRKVTLNREIILLGINCCTK